MKALQNKLSLLVVIGSTLLCIGSCLLWIRSYHKWEYINYSRETRDGPAYVHTLWQAGSGDGGIKFIYWVQKRSWAYEVVEGFQLRAETPSAEGGIFAPGSDTFWFKHNFSFSIMDGNVPGAIYSYHRIGLLLPWWVLVVLFAVSPGLALPKRLRRRWRSTHGLCARCGYDLRATEGACPECGTMKSLPA